MATETTQDKEAQIKEMIRQTFNTVADKYGTGSARFFHLAGAFMAGLHELQGNEHMLDVASGTGAVAIPLAQRLTNGRLTAVDFSPGMLSQAKEYANEKQLKNIEFLMQDMTAMNFSENQFDHANCSFGLFFVEDMPGLLQHIASKVKPGGQVIVSGFCGDSFLPAAELIMQDLKDWGVDVPDQPIGWKRMAEPNQLQDLFDQAGLHNMQITRKSFGYYVDEAGWWDVVWNAGFRGLVAQLGDKVDDFRKAHLEQLKSHMNSQGYWLEVDVNFTRGTKQ